jgi:2-phospho-L-lactate/phosphoenolpyruvate guanylyltransferase
VTGTVAVVPLRDGRSGKTRLSASLGARDRAALVVELARHVVSTLVGSQDVAEVVVVSAEPVWARAALADVGGVRVVAQPTDRPGLNAAVDVGRSLVLGEGTGRRLLVVHADLPALEPDDVAALIAAEVPEAAAHGAGASDAGAMLSHSVRGPATSRVVLATDRAGSGTNALLLDPVDPGFPFRFGVGSLRAHLEEADRIGSASVVLRRTGTACDLDTVADWSALPEPVRQRVIRAVPALARLPIEVLPG